MSHVYITNNGSVLGIDGGRFVIKQKDNLMTSIPKETVESISVFGNSTITTRCMQELLAGNIPVCFFSSRGRYFGRLESTDGSKITQMKKQFAVFEDEEYTLELARKIAMAKISNQITVLRRYMGDKKELFNRQIDVMKQLKVKASNGMTNPEIMGYEGNAARIYFEVLSNVIRPEFKFYGRNRRPPKDPFNSLISLGYTLLLYEIVSKLQIQGLNPYLGFLHKPRDGSPSLASDMMEEWRAVIVDSVVMSMIQGNEISFDDFDCDDDNVGVYIHNDAMKKFIDKFEKKLTGKMKYLTYDNNEYTFREAMSIQCHKLAESINANDAGVYMSVMIR
ncbi:MAG: CRISPR-associated endonuclease Cas1 [Clostridiales bacterium]|nr:CRISPR-associated endonuclease Cas1 [Clostridiales bacterium]